MSSSRRPARSRQTIADGRSRSVCLGYRAGQSSRRFLPDSGRAVNVPRRKIHRSRINPKATAGKDAKSYSLRELNPTIADTYFMRLMTPSLRSRLATSLRAIGVRQVRLACGLVLYAYLLSHFLNHALGNISMDALAAGVRYHTLFWRFLPVAIVFYLAALIHVALGIWAFYQRRQFKWKAIEPLQLVLGLSIPALIITHIIGVRLGQTLYGHEKLYPQELYSFWVAHPYKIWMMPTVLVIAWTHGCIGLYFWLRMKTFFDRAAPYLLAAAVLIPTLALLGFYQGGRRVVEDSITTEWHAQNLSPRQVGTPAEQDALD